MNVCAYGLSLGMNLTGHGRSMTHFQRRARERGVPGDVVRVEAELRAAYLSQNDKVLEYVMETHGDKIFRFLVQGSIFYVIITPQGWPKTVLTQDHISVLKKARKKGIGIRAAARRAELWKFCESSKRRARCGINVADR